MKSNKYNYLYYFVTNGLNFFYRFFISLALILIAFTIGLYIDQIQATFCFIYLVFIGSIYVGIRNLPTNQSSVMPLYIALLINFTFIYGQSHNFVPHLVFMVMLLLICLKISVISKIIWKLIDLWYTPNHYLKSTQLDFLMTIDKENKIIDAFKTNSYIELLTYKRQIFDDEITYIFEFLASPNKCLPKCYKKIKIKQYTSIKQPSDNYTENPIIDFKVARLSDIKKKSLSTETKVNHQNLTIRKPHLPKHMKAKQQRKRG